MRFRAYSTPQLDKIAPVAALSEQRRFEMKVVSTVLPFRVNDYVIDELIDWSRVPDDPVFQLTFPQRGMLAEEHFTAMAEAFRRDAPKPEIKAIAAGIRAALNPHPAGQKQNNVPRLDGVPLPGVQHKYDETVLFFPTQGQTCHSYCTFCFRWAQFIGDKELKFASSESERLADYLAAHPEVSDVLITGGDPMVMKTKNLAPYLEALLDPRLEHIQNVRIGSKSLTFWPHRYVSDRDADDVLRLFERVVAAGKHLAFMAHFNHPHELGPSVAERAVQRIRATGAVIRAQAPLLRHINDDARTWNDNWRRQLQLGIVPYYMFVERDTGARCYFEVPLARAYEIYREAVRHVSGLGRTARGPSMSAGPGKVEIQGVAEVAGEKVFVLRFIQARESHWVQRPFFATFDPEATWLNHLRPAFGASKFFFQEEYEQKYGARDLK
ncbi:MAG: lysine 2,3-aminomutase [Myxococcota bacterium]